MAYSFRFDVKNTHANRKIIKEWCNQFDKYIISIEHGTQTGKEHYQGIIFSTKHIETVRKNRPFDCVKSQYSIAPVKDIITYESYLHKETVYVIQGYTQEYIDTIPKWVSKLGTQPRKPKSFLEIIITNYKYDKTHTLKEYSDYVLRQLNLHVKSFTYTQYEGYLNAFAYHVSKTYRETIKQNFYERYTEKVFPIRTIVPPCGDDNVSEKSNEPHEENVFLYLN